MRSFWRMLRSYLWWTYPRATLHYDVMVTLILAFIFLAPLWVNFKDKPPEPNLHPKDVVVTSDGRGGYIYQVDAAGVSALGDPSSRSPAELREALYDVIEPIAGDVRIQRFEPVRDAKGQTTAYKVWIER